MSEATALTSRPTVVRELSAFLVDNRVQVLDVTSGAPASTRRLFLGRLGDGQPTHEVVVATSGPAGAAVETESRRLDELYARLSAVMRATIPRVVEPVLVSGKPGIVLTAVPGLRAVSDLTLPARARAEAAAVQAWLEQLWLETADHVEAVDLGRDVLDVVHSRSRRVGELAETVRAVDRAYARLSAFVIPRTASHGCLCRRHVFVEDGVVTGVDGWGAAQLRSDPLRDLGHWVVRSSGRRLDQVMTARTPLNRTLRDFVMTGLAVWAIPPTYWRDVLLLVEAELAVKELREGDLAAMDLLTRASSAMPRDMRREGTHT
jgi:hypothetical protein